MPLGMSIQCNDYAIDRPGMFGDKRGNAIGILGGGGDGEGAAGVEILLDVDEEEGRHGHGHDFCDLDL